MPLHIIQNKQKLTIVKQQNKINIAAVGMKGDTGTGVGIQSATVTAQNELLLTLTDLSVISAGTISVNPVQTVQDEFQFTGTEVQFVLAYSTVKAIVTINGLQQKNITDYAITGNILTFTSTLEVDDDIIVTYWV